MSATVVQSASPANDESMAKLEAFLAANPDLSVTQKQMKKLLAKYRKPGDQAPAAAERRPRIPDDEFQRLRHQNRTERLIRTNFQGQMRELVFQSEWEEAGVKHRSQFFIIVQVNATTSERHGHRVRVSYAVARYNLESNNPDHNTWLTPDQPMYRSHLMTATKRFEEPKYKRTFWLNRVIDAPARPFGARQQRRAFNTKQELMDHYADIMGQTMLNKADLWEAGATDPTTTVWDMQIKQAIRAHMVKHPKHPLIEHH